MKLNQDQIKALRNVSPELADKLEAGESVTVEREVKRWEPQEGNFIVDRYGAVRRVDCDVFSNRGAARKSREAAERLASDQSIFNRLHAYREEFAPGYVVPEIGNSVYSPAFDGDKWDFYSAFAFRSPTEVYMPHDVCKELCRKLNSGEVVL